jgi:cytidine deaminase
MKITKEKLDELIEATIKVKNHSYSPYSNFKVGSSVLTKKGNIYSGTNVGTTF